MSDQSQSLQSVPSSPLTLARNRGEQRVSSRYWNSGLSTQYFNIKVWWMIMNDNEWSEYILELEFFIPLKEKIIFAMVGDVQWGIKLRSTVLCNWSFYCRETKQSWDRRTSCWVFVFISVVSPRVGGCISPSSCLSISPLPPPSSAVSPVSTKVTSRDQTSHTALRSISM